MKRWLLAMSLSMACLSTAPAEGSAAGHPGRCRQQSTHRKRREGRFDCAPGLRRRKADRRPAHQ